MKRLTEKMVFCGLVTAWRLAAWPTRRSPLFVESDDRRRGARAFGVFEHGRLAAFHDGHAGIGGAEVDAENFSHMSEGFRRMERRGASAENCGTTRLAHPEPMIF